MSDTQVANAQKWAIDPSHTEVQFKVKHLVISTVTGRFDKFEGEIYTENHDFDEADVDFTIDVNSISTNSTDRDNHLKSDDFFAADKHPHIKFTNGKLVKEGDDYQLTGDLTIRETTKQVTLDVAYNGTVNDPWGNAKAGFGLSGKINRKDFGLTWNTITESGGVLVGEDVKMDISVQLGKA